jgi:hypothetical protein
MDRRLNELAKLPKLLALEDRDGRIIGQLLDQLRRPQRDEVLARGHSRCCGTGVALPCPDHLRFIG